MWSSARLTAPFVVLVLLASCTNPLDGLPDHEIPEFGGTGGVSSETGGSALGGASTSGGAGNGVPQAGSSGSGAPGLGGTSGGAPSGGTGTGGVGMGAGGTNTDGTSTGGTGIAGGTGGSGTGAGGTSVPTGGTGVGGTGIATGGTAGSGAPGGSGPGGGSAFSAVSAIVVRACATAQCHGGRRMPNLTAANLYTTLTSTAVSECGNDRLVTPGDPGNSALLSVVNGLCGELIMPANCEAPPCLGAADQKTISDWITAGAPR
jgi:hypothetical protein